MIPAALNVTKADVLTEECTDHLDLQLFTIDRQVSLESGCVIVVLAEGTARKIRRDWVPDAPLLHGVSLLRKHCASVFESVRVGLLLSAGEESVTIPAGTLAAIVVLEPARLIWRKQIEYLSS